MPTLTVMDRTGDTRTAFDPANASEVSQAEQQFNALIGKRHMAFASRPDGTKTQIRAFDPNVDIVMFPNLMGG